MDDAKKQDLFDAIKHGSVWYSEKITEYLRDIIKKQPSHFGSHYLSWDSDDKYHYIYDNECYLFVFDDRIQVRSDRDNVFSSNQTINFAITSKDDISAAYEMFCSMTMEDEET